MISTLRPALGGAILAGALCAGGAAQAETLKFQALINDVSGLTAADGMDRAPGANIGRVDLMFDTMTSLLSVKFNVSGFETGQLHLAHIHGTFDGGASGTPTDAMSPTLADDASGNGVVDLTEGAPAYGPIILALKDDSVMAPFGGFGEAEGPNGVIDDMFTFDLSSTSAFGEIGSTGTFYDADDLMPFDFREIVIHGATLANGGGFSDTGHPNDVGPGEYSAFVPVGVGEITAVAAVPLPAAGWALIAAIGGLGALRARRRG